MLTGSTQLAAENDALKAEIARLKAYIAEMEKDISLAADLLLMHREREECRRP